jgi:hypothetical protein
MWEGSGSYPIDGRTVMPDLEGNEKGEETKTPLHAYKDGREEDVEGAEETKEGNPEAASDREPGEHTSS